MKRRNDGAGVKVSNQQKVQRVQKGKLFANREDPQKSSQVHASESPVGLAISLTALVLSLVSLILHVHHLSSENHPETAPLVQQTSKETEQPFTSVPVDNGYRPQRKHFYSPSFHSSLDSSYALNGSVLRPAAVFYGDIILKGGTVKTDDHQPSHAETVRASMPPIHTPQQVQAGIKDIYNMDTGTGVCGHNYFMGSHMIGVIYCMNCTENDFSNERGLCCRRPSKCAQAKNSTCQYYYDQVSCTANAGCRYLPQKIIEEGSGKITYCVAKERKTTWLSHLVPDPMDTTSLYYRDRQRKIYQEYGATNARIEMDRPSYHVDPAHRMDLVQGPSYHLFDTATGLPYAFQPDEVNPEIMAFEYASTHGTKPSPVSFSLFDDPVELHEPSGTQKANVEVEAFWDPTKHYDLSINKASQKLEFVYNSPTRIPFQVLVNGILRGTALIRLHNSNITLAPSHVKSVASAQTYLQETNECQAIVDGHLACFQDPDIPYSTCTANLHTHGTAQCCGHLYLHNIYVDCHKI